MSNKDRDLSGRLMDAGLLLRLVQNRNTYAAPSGLCAEKILTLLKSRPGIGEKELADLSGIRRNRLARWLNRLGYEGLVESGDGGAEVGLTKAGAKEAEKIERGRAKTESLFDCLTAEDREKLSDILDRLSTRLKEETDEDGEDFDDLPECRRFGRFDHGVCGPRPGFHAFSGRPGRVPW